MSRVSLQGGVMMDHEYEAVFKIGRLGSFFLSRGGSGGEGGRAVNE